MVIFRRALWSLLVTLLVNIFGTGASRYCDISPEHTLCKYHGPGPACGPHLLATGVSPSDVVVILDIHNQLRSQLAQGLEQRGSPGPQPPAADMRMLQWDDELAAIAQMHARQCVFEHECNSCRRVDRWPVGQNLYISSANIFQSGNAWSAIIEDWYSEVEGFDGTSVEGYKYAHTTGHFTQMTWATTIKIGCGFSMFQDENGWFKKLYTCNYGPDGNSIDAPMYSVGIPCSKCPNEGCSYDYPGLCSGKSTGSAYPSEFVDNVQRQQFQGIQPASGNLPTPSRRTSDPRTIHGTEAIYDQPASVNLLTPSRRTSDPRTIHGTEAIYDQSSFGNSLKTVFSNPGTTFANGNNVSPTGLGRPFQIQPVVNGATTTQTSGTRSNNLVNNPAYPQLGQQHESIAKHVFKDRQRTHSQQVDNSAPQRLSGNFLNGDFSSLLEQSDSSDLRKNRPSTIDRILQSTNKDSLDLDHYEPNNAYHTRQTKLGRTQTAPPNGADVDYPSLHNKQTPIRLPAWNTLDDNNHNNNLASLSTQLAGPNYPSRPIQYDNNHPPLVPQLVDSDFSSRPLQYGNYMSTLATQQMGSNNPSWQTFDDDYSSTLATQQMGSNNPSWQTFDDDYLPSYPHQSDPSDPAWLSLDEEYMTILSDRPSASYPSRQKQYYD